MTPRKIIECNSEMTNTHRDFEDETNEAIYLIELALKQDVLAAKNSIHNPFCTSNFAQAITNIGNKQLRIIVEILKSEKFHKLFGKTKTTKNIYFTEKQEARICNSIGLTCEQLYREHVNIQTNPAKPCMCSIICKSGNKRAVVAVDTVIHI